MQEGSGEIYQPTQPQPQEFSPSQNPNSKAIEKPLSPESNIERTKKIIIDTLTAKLKNITIKTDQSTLPPPEDDNSQKNQEETLEQVQQRVIQAKNLLQTIENPENFENLFFGENDELIIRFAEGGGAPLTIVIKKDNQGNFLSFLRDPQGQDIPVSFSLNEIKKITYTKLLEKPTPPEDQTQPQPEATPQSSLQEKAPTNNTIDLELTRRLIVKGPLDIVFEDASIEDREGLVELLTGGEISSSNLSNIAEYLGYITQKSLVEVLGIEADLTLEKVKTILTGTNIPKTNGKIDYSQIKEPHERAKVRYYELFLNSQGDMPTIVDGKTIEEIFKVLDPDAFRSSEPLTLRKILEKSYKRLPKETKKEIKDATKQKDDAEKTETTSEQDIKIDPNIKSFLEQIFAVKPEDLEGFLDKSIG